MVFWPELDVEAKAEADAPVSVFPLTMWAADPSVPHAFLVTVVLPIAEADR